MRYDRVQQHLVPRTGLQTRGGVHKYASQLCVCVCIRVYYVCACVCDMTGCSSTWSRALACQHVGGCTNMQVSYVFVCVCVCLFLYVCARYGRVQQHLVLHTMHSDDVHKDTHMHIMTHTQ